MWDAYHILKIKISLDILLTKEFQVYNSLKMCQRTTVLCKEKKNVQDVKGGQIAESC